MTHAVATPLDRVRDVALLLPETEERTADGKAAFVVADAVFADVDGDTLLLLAAGTSERARFDLGGDVDWPLVEDAIAHSWELAAPARLLEAGGR